MTDEPIDGPVERKTNKLKNKILLDWIYYETDYFDVVFPASYDQVMQNEWAFAPEKIIERYLAILSKGALTFIDGAGYDYTDYSDAKTFCTTVEVANNYSKKKGTTPSHGLHRYTLTNLNKAGAIRAMCANTQRNCVDYFYIPAEDLRRIVHFDRCKDKNKNNVYYRISSKYNSVNDRYWSLEPFRVADVYELVMASPTYKPKPYVPRSLETILEQSLCD